MSAMSSGKEMKMNPYPFLANATLGRQAIDRIDQELGSDGNELIKQISSETRRKDGNGDSDVRR